MNVVRTIAECRHARKRMGSVALVPTMGALHAGHLSLMTAAKGMADHVAASIFVNPTQFGPREDFSKYPRPIEEDLEVCRGAGVELVFVPTVEEMYGKGSPAIAISLPGLTDVLEGQYRPGHFSGVCQVVAKLFHVVQPTKALFGQKDFQQLRVISAMVEALDMPVQIVGRPTVREADGLALSSRNRYLTAEQRARALAIHRALDAGQAELRRGIRQANRINAAMRAALLDLGPAGNPLGRVQFTIDYAAAVDGRTLQNLETVAGKVLLAIAARVGETRLIDNYYLNEDGEEVKEIN